MANKLIAKNGGGRWGKYKKKMSFVQKELVVFFLINRYDLPA